MNYWLNRLREYWNDKKLAEKCGLEVKDICVHESDYKIGDWLGTQQFSQLKCKKWGEFYR